MTVTKVTASRGFTSVFSHCTVRNPQPTRSIMQHGPMEVEPRVTYHIMPWLPARCMVQASAASSCSANSLNAASFTCVLVRPRLYRCVGFACRAHLLWCCCCSPRPPLPCCPNTTHSPVQLLSILLSKITSVLEELTTGERCNKAHKVRSVVTVHDEHLEHGLLHFSRPCCNGLTLGTIETRV